MKTYKTFIKLNDGTLRSIFHLFYYKNGENWMEDGTIGISSWKKYEEAERYKETLIARLYYNIIILEIEVDPVNLIKVENSSLYSKESYRELPKPKPPKYGTQFYHSMIKIL